MKPSTSLIQGLSKSAILQFTIAVSLSLIVVSCDKNDDDNYEPELPPAATGSLMSAAGDSATVVGTINQFRAKLGDSLNVAPGKTSGRREVNWDGVPPAFTNANNFPSDFFGSAVATDGNGRKRGLLMTNTGTSFRVDSTSFAEVDASYAGQFQAFSRKRLFTYMGNNVTKVAFAVPGSLTPAFVKGFGVIFSDVDSDNSTSVEYFDGTTSLGVYKVAAHPASGNFSFVGVYFANAKVTSVQITSGNGLLAAGVKDISDGGSKDLVVMDDFFYNEPDAIQ